MNYQKYTKMYHPVPLENREWPTNEITKAPIWCSVDLRDGNQALYSPMTIDEKIEFFEKLVEIGFKEIEVGFPAASNTEFEFVRRLIDENRIPDDVSIQVLTQARDHIIRKTVEAIKGAKNAIIHLYNSTSTLQRKVVFKMDKDEVKKLAIEGAKLVVDLVKDFEGNVRFEYSPESFTCTEPEYAVEVTNAVLDILKPTPERKVIVNLPSTIEVATVNVYADQIEYMCKNLNNRENLVISVHAHNDRGTGVASSELALLAGADRVEGTLFGNGERTGNTDIITVALNMFCQGIDPKLNIENIDELIKMYESYNKLPIHPRHPYAGEMAYVAFSGSHQDAIKKSMDMFNSGAGEGKWANPYLTIDPSDIGRKYEPIQINSQSGKGGVAYIMENKYGYVIPKAMLVEFSKLITDMSDEKQTVLSNSEIHHAFKDNYVGLNSPLDVKEYHCSIMNSMTYINAHISYNGEAKTISGEGNGPLDAFSDAIRKALNIDFDIIAYSEHALQRKSNSLAATYIEIKQGEKCFWGAGVDGSINTSSLHALVSALNRSL